MSMSDYPTLYVHTNKSKGPVLFVVLHFAFTTMTKTHTPKMSAKLSITQLSDTHI